MGTLARVENGRARVLIRRLLTLSHIYKHQAVVLVSRFCQKLLPERRLSPRRSTSGTALTSRDKEFVQRTLIRFARHGSPLLQLIRRQHRQHPLQSLLGIGHQCFWFCRLIADQLVEATKSLGFDGSHSLFLIGVELQSSGYIQFAECSCALTLQRDLPQTLPLFGSQDYRQRGFVFAGDHE